MLSIARLTAATATGILFFVGTTYVISAGQKPEKTQGLTDVRLQQFPLGAQISAMAGYELRGRRVTLAPGGAVIEHSHADRPGIVYILEGSLTEGRGGKARVYKAGDSWAEDTTALHWLENTTDKPAVFVAVDLVKQ